MIVSLIFVFREFRNIKQYLAETNRKVNECFQQKNQPQKVEVQNSENIDDSDVEQDVYEVIMNADEEEDHEDDINEAELNEVAQEVENEIIEEDEDENVPVETDSDEEKDEYTQLQSLNTSQLRQILSNYGQTNIPKNKRKADLIQDILLFKKNDKQSEASESNTNEQ
jgi:hypothetical protein